VANALTNDPGPLQQQGHADGFVKGQLLARPAVAAEHIAMVACIHDNGVVTLPGLFERGQ
jgi:hypothetical protein